MIRLVKDRLGGDAALLDVVEELALTGKQAVAILDAASRASA